MVENTKLKEMATREAYGKALVALGKKYRDLVVLDAGTNNSTYSLLFKENYPKRFFEMFIAEQNMIGVGVGLAKRGYVPFASTFAAFLTRAHDQLRMASYSKANLKICGSHCGVSIGEDGASQMGLEDISLFRSLYGATVLYPSDQISTYKLAELIYKTEGIGYLRTTRMAVPTIYNQEATFVVGGLQIVKKSTQDKLAVIGAGITLHEALKAYDFFLKKGINIRIIDLYCLKPISKEKIAKALVGIKQVVTVEDHYPEGGLGEAVRSVLPTGEIRQEVLAVNKLPKSGRPEELMAYENIDCKAIINKVNQLL